MWATPRFVLALAKALAASVRRLSSATCGGLDSGSGASTKKSAYSLYNFIWSMVWLGAAASQFMRAVGGQNDERDPRLMGFDDSGEEVGGGGAGCADDSGWRAGGHGNPQREEGGAALVEVRAEGDGVAVAGKGEDEGGVAAAGAMQA